VTCGVDPVLVFTGAEAAMRQVLASVGMAADDIDLYEINEAFAVAPLMAIRALALDPERVNVNGGAISYGHPFGATGAMIFGTLLDELERRDLTTGLAAMAIGTGMGIATVVERLS
jgi:acetyl-CoA C-acetyltransferase